MTTDPDALDTLRELRKLARDVGAIIASIADRDTLTAEELSRVRVRYQALKAELAAAAEKPPRNSYEDDYLGPAIFAVTVHLTPPAHTHPIRDEWLPALETARGDISQYLKDLEDDSAL